MFKKSLAAAAAAVGMVVFGAQAAEFTAADGTVFQVNFAAQAEMKETKQTTGAVSTITGDGQFQMKASKKVNDDLSVFGQLEVDFDPVVDNATPAGDDAIIGLSSKAFGTFQAGQFDSYMEDNIAEALSYWNDAAADVKVTELGVTNDGRSIQYVGKFGDFTGVVGFQSSNGGSATGETSTGTSFVLGYQANGIKVTVGQSFSPKYKSDTFAATNLKSATGGAISYTFGTTTVSALTLKQTSSTDYDTTVSGLGVHHIMGDFDFGLAMQKKTVNASSGTTDTNEWALQGAYTVTKGTKFYANMLGLGATGGAGDLMTVGLKTSF